MMFNRNRRIDRRFFLKGAGIAMALPMLNIMGDETSQKKAATSPKRLACFFFPDGVSLPPTKDPAHKDWNWFPLGDRNNYKFTKVLEPLEALRKDSTIISGLSHPITRQVHAHNTAATYLTGTYKGRTQKSVSISLDQVYANMVGRETRYKSLVMSTDGGVGTMIGSQTMSYNKDGRPIFAESSPKRLFYDLFVTPDEAERKALGTEQSILDFVMEHGRNLQKKLGVVDKERFTNYLEAVREVEKRLKKAEDWINIPKPKPNVELDPEIKPLKNAREYVRTMYDLIWLAFETDSTRTATYQIGQENAQGVSDYLSKAVGIPRAHTLTHKVKDEDGWKNLGTYNRFLVEEFAHFLNRLKSSKDGLDPLLDNTLCFFGSSTSRYHKSNNYPLILAGGKKMGFKHGQFIKCVEEESDLSDLYLTMAQQLGVGTDKFAKSTKTFSEVLA